MRPNPYELIKGVPKLLPVDEFLLESPAKPNLLLEGPELQMEAALATLMTMVSQPVATWVPGNSGPLPLIQSGTLVIHEVDRLDDHQQRQLVQWLDGAVRRVQVISTTSEPLFAMVERGVFLDLLYYRLNVVRVEI